MVADVGFLARMLPDVHLKVRELQVSLGASRVQADEWLSLLLGLCCLLLADQVAGLLSDLGHNESWVGRHCHLDWRSTFIHKSIRRNSG